MSKFLICHDMLRSECLLLLNINFVNSGKECKKATMFFLMNLANYILIYMTKLKKKILIKSNDNLKYLNDVSGLQKMRTNEMLCGKK